MEAIASRLEAIATRVEVIASRLEAIASRVEAIHPAELHARLPKALLSSPVIIKFLAFRSRCTLAAATKIH